MTSDQFTNTKPTDRFFVLVDYGTADNCIGYETLEQALNHVAQEAITFGDALAYTIVDDNESAASQIKFGIRFGNQKRGKIVRGATVIEYLKSIGLDPINCGPNGGVAGRGGKTVGDPKGSQSYVGGERVEFGITIY